MESHRDTGTGRERDTRRETEIQREGETDRLRGRATEREGHRQAEGRDIDTVKD